MPAWLPSCGGVEPRRAASSAPYSPAAAGARRNTHRVYGPARPQPATAPPAALSAVPGCCETDPTAVATGRLIREGVLFCASRSAAPRRLNELNRASGLASRTLAENSRCTGGLINRFAPDQSMDSRSTPSAGVMRSKLMRMSRRFLIVRQLVRFQPEAPSFGTVAEW